MGGARVVDQAGRAMNDPDRLVWTVILAGLGWIEIWLMLKPMFWVFALCVGGLAAAFTTLASIIHFQIGGALLFFFLMGACWLGAIFILMDKNDKAQIERERLERRSRRRGLLIFGQPPTNAPELQEMPLPEQPAQPPPTETPPNPGARPTPNSASLHDVRRRFRYER